jgi:polysaccharide pyruvyl transferase WcaK-like protein
MGVTALFHSAASALARRVENLDLRVFDFRDGAGEAECRLEKGVLRYRRYGARHSKRIYQPENLTHISLAASLGGLWNPSARAVLTSDTVLDLSAGDSFTDLYGRFRFHQVSKPKLLALRCRKPLVLLPQTYGPFDQDWSRNAASGIVRRAAMAWARDEHSFAVLKDLVGDDFDPERHRQGVDVAFLLETRPPAEEHLAELGPFIENRGNAPLFGLNVSGLLYNDPARAREQFALKADYRAVVKRLVDALLRNSDARLILVPHVMALPGSYESDIEACEAVRNSLDSESADRVKVGSRDLDECEVKWVIGKTDWFCGTRMHSTIAALSQGVPACTISYSPKAIGVFESCGQGDHVVDPKALGDDEVLSGVLRSVEERGEAATTLAERIVDVRKIAGEQADAIAALCMQASRDD